MNYPSCSCNRLKRQLGQVQKSDYISLTYQTAEIVNKSTQLRNSQFNKHFGVQKYRLKLALFLLKFAAT